MWSINVLLPGVYFIFWLHICVDKKIIKIDSHINCIFLLHFHWEHFLFDCLHVDELRVRLNGINNARKKKEIPQNPKWKTPFKSESVNNCRYMCECRVAQCERHNSYILPYHPHSMPAQHSSSTIWWRFYMCWENFCCLYVCCVIIQKEECFRSTPIYFFVEDEIRRMYYLTQARRKGGISVWREKWCAALSWK